MQFSVEDQKNNVVMGVISYIWFLALIPFFTAKDSEYAQFHAKQGINLAIVQTVVGVVAGILGFIPFVGWLIGAIVGLASLAASIYGIVIATGTEAKEIPYVSMIKIVK